MKLRTERLIRRAVFAPGGWGWSTLIAAACCAAPRLSDASTIRDDTPDSDYTSFSAQSQYASSGFIDVILSSGEIFGSATLVAPDWVLTAAHVVTQDNGVGVAAPAFPAAEVSFGQGASTTPFVTGPDSVASIAVESGWDYNLSNGNDLALVQLASPITNVAPAQLYQSSFGAEIGQTATIVGYGDTGTGLTGATGGPGTRRAIQNVIDAFGGQTTTGGPPNFTTSNFAGLSSNVELTDFDQPNNPSASIMGSSTPLSLEGCSAPGDSGGGLFLTANNQTYLEAVTDFVGAEPGNSISTNPDGFYGDYNGYTRLDVASSMSFIDSTLVTTSNWSLSGGGSWASIANWTAGQIPEFAAATANFTSGITTNSTITLDANWTVGTINFNNVNSYTIAAGNNGVLTLDNGGATATALITDTGGTHFISAPLTLNSNLLVTVANPGNALTFSGSISGVGGLTKSGAGNLILSSGGSYAGATLVNGGLLEISQGNLLTATPSLQVAAGGAAGSDAGSTTDAAFLQLLNQAPSQSGGFALDAADSNVNIDYTGKVAGAFNMTKPFAGATTSLVNMSIGAVSAGITYTGTITPAGNVYLLGGGGQLTLPQTSAGKVPLPDVAGSTSLLAENGGIVALATTNTYSGSTTIHGSMVLANPATNTQLLEPTTLQVSYLGDPLAGDANGSSIGTSTPSNPSNLVINGGILRYVGGGDASSRVFTIGTLGATLDSSGTGPVAFDSALAEAFSNSGSTSLTLTGSNVGANVLDASLTDPTGGQLSLVKGGTGFWQLGGNSTFSGGATVNAGTLQLLFPTALGATSAPLSVSGTLDLNSFSPAVGSLSGSGIVENNASSTTATLTVGSANISTSYTGVLISAAGALSLIKTGTGTLTLTGANSYSGGTTLSAGELSVSSDSNLGGPTTAVTFNGGVMQVTGTGLTSLNTHSVNWSAFNGGFDIASSANTFTVGATLLGSGSFTKLGAGTLNLTAVNSYTGGTNVGAGLLTINSDRAVGLGSVSFSGGTLQFNNYASSLAFTNAPALSLGAAGGTASSLSGNITDGANKTALAYVGPGTLALSGNNTYSAVTTLYGGELSISAASNIGTNSITFSGGTLGITGNSLTSLTNINGANFSGGFDIASAANTFTVSSSLSGPGSLTKLGVGTLALSGVNSYSGVTTILAGTLQLGGGSALGSSSMLTLGGGTLDLHGFSPTVANLTGSGTIDDLSATSSIFTDNSNANATFSGKIQNSSTGIVSFTKSGAGTLTLSGANSYSGGTTVTGGILQMGNASALGAAGGSLSLTGGEVDLHGFSLSVGTFFGAGTIDDVSSSNATLTVGGNSATTFTGILINSGSGSLSLVKSGLGTLVLTNANSYSGGTTIQSGTLQVGNSLALGNASAPLNVTGGELDLHGNNTTVGSLTGTGTITDLTATAVNFTYNSALSSTFAGVIQSPSGSINLIKSGTGTLTLTGANTYTGTTSINQGAIELGNGGSSGSIGAGSISDSSSLIIDRSDSSGSIASAITGGGSLTMIGSGTFALTAADSFTGGTNIQSGALQLGNGSTTGSVTGAINDGATLIIDRSDATLNFSNAVSGSGGVSLTGTGTVTFSAVNTYSGTTTVAAGALVIPAVSALPAGGTVVNNSSLCIQTGTSAAPLITGAITGSGSLTVGKSSAPAYLRLNSSSGTSSVGALTINSGSTLDLTNNTLDINFASAAVDPATTIRSYITSAYNGDTWTGSGLTSGIAASNPSLYAVGYVDGDRDSGTAALANQIIVKTTLAGDANLDGTVNFADLLVVAQNFNHTTDTHGNPLDWADGDFNYDNVVNFADLLLVAQNFNKTLGAGQLAQLPTSFAADWQLAEAEIAAAPTPVPEPASAAIFAGAASALLMRRRRRAIPFADAR
ncbi:MAG: autotransporter-associated beta strand repeat-containing protein [Tepidisphaeraceae bacterium]